VRFTVVSSEGKHRLFSHRDVNATGRDQAQVQAHHRNGGQDDDFVAIEEFVSSFPDILVAEAVGADGELTGLRLHFVPAAVLQVCTSFYIRRMDALNA